jgi:hypothetical protein
MDPVGADVRAMSEVRAVPEVDDALRQELLTCWTDVTNAGGAVGFVPR